MDVLGSWSRGRYPSEANASSSSSFWKLYTLDLVVLTRLALKVYPYPIGLGVENVRSVLSFAHVLTTLELRLPPLTIFIERILPNVLQQPMH